MRTIAEHIMDIVQNSIRAEATLIEVIINECKKNNICTLTITDNGSGMDARTLQQAVDPFFTSRNTRKVGLGIPLLKQNAEAAGGYLELASKLQEGTTLKAGFQLSHIDKPPLGDMGNTMYLLFLGCPKGKLVYQHVTDDGGFSINSEELKESLGKISLQKREIMNGIIELIETNLDEIGVKR